MRSDVWKLLTAVLILIFLTSGLAACGSTAQPVKEVVTQVVKETVIVAGTPEVVEKVVTQVVEKQVETVVTATPEPAPEKVSPGADTLVFNLDQVIQGGLDASQTIDSTSKKAAFHVSETLVEFDEAVNDVKPKLATSWEALPDGLTYIFHLREGVKFQDGTDFNADAVVDSLMRIYDENNPLHDTGEFRYASFIPIKLVEKVDDYTVKITATHKDPIFMWRMSMEPGYIQSPTAIKKWGKEYTNHAVGTGPFKVVKFDAATGATLERFDDYWGKKPSYKTLVFKVNPDGESKVADLLAGNVDIITRPPADQIEMLRNTPGIKVEVFPLRWLGYINLNTSHPPLDDVLVRKAVNYGFDRETLSNVLNLGISSQPLYSVWTEGSYAYEPNVTTYHFNPEKAKGLLEEAGWTLPEGGVIREKNGVPLEIRLAQAGELYGPEKPIPELFQSNMRDIGMSVKIVRIDPSMFWDTKVGAWNPDTAEATVFGWIAFVPDPITVFDRFTSMMFPPTGYNMTWWSNPRVDELYNLANSELDLNKRADYFKEIQRIVMENVPTVHHSIVTLPLAWNERVSGIKVRGNVTVDLTGVTIAP